MIHIYHGSCVTVLKFLALLLSILLSHSSFLEAISDDISDERCAYSRVLINLFLCKPTSYTTHSSWFIINLTRT